MLLNYFAKCVTFIFLLFFFGIFSTQAEENVMFNQIYRSNSTKVEKRELLDSFLSSESNSKEKDFNKILESDIQKIYPIQSKDISLSSHFKEIGLVLNKSGEAAAQFNFSNLPTESPLKVFNLTGTWENKNSVTELHLNGTNNNVKFSINGIMLPDGNNLTLNAVFSLSVLGARHIEQLIIPLIKETNTQTEQWKFLFDALNNAEKNQFIKQQEARERLLSEPNEWINGVPVPSRFNTRMTYNIDGKEKETNATILLDKNSKDLTIKAFIAPEGDFSSSWNIEQSEKMQVTTNNGKIKAVITSPQSFNNGINWITKNPNHPDMDAFILSVEEGIIDIQLSEEGKKISATINAKGKASTTSNVISTFSAKFSGQQAGMDLVEKYAHYIGGRPFDGLWDIPKQGELSLHQKQNKVDGMFLNSAIEDGLVKNGIFNFRFKTNNNLHNGFLSVASDGVLTGMTWNENNNISFKPVIAVQKSIPSINKNTLYKSSFQIDNEDQASSLRFLGYDLIHAGKYKEATNLLLQVLQYYKKSEKNYKIESSPSEYKKLKDNLITQSLILNILPQAAVESNNYPALLESLKAAIHVKKELEKNQNDPRIFREYLENYIATQNKYISKLDKLKTAFESGEQALSSAGIGINFDTKKLGIKIISVRPDMPASQAGIIVGDSIVAINGKSITEIDAENASNLLLGQVGSSVSIKLLHDGKYRELKLTRSPLFAMSSETREELIKSFSDMKNYLGDFSSNLSNTVDKLNNLKMLDVTIAFNEFISNMETQQKPIVDYREKIIELNQHCLAHSPTALNIFQRYSSLMNIITEKNIQGIAALEKNPSTVTIEQNQPSQEDTELMLKIDQEEEEFENNPTVSEIDKSSLRLAILTFSEFATMQVDISGNIRNIKQANKSLTLSPDAIKTANTLNWLASLLDSWRSKMITDEAKIASLNYGQNFYNDYVQVLLDMNLPEQALQASETARARAFADLLAKSHSEKNEQATKSITLDEIRQLVKDTGNTVVEYFVLNDSLLTWTISLKPNKEVKIDFHKTLINKKTLDNKIDNLIKALEPLKSSKQLTQDGNNKRTETAKTELKILYNILIAPIESLLPQKPDEIITIVPHGKLFQVPFSALIQVKNDKTENYVVQNHTLTYAPSLSVLNLSRQIKRELVTPFSLLAAIRPDLENIPDELGKKFEELPSIERINEATINFYAPKSNLILSGKEATQEKVLAEAKSRDILLFYTHAKAFDKKPLESYVALTDKLMNADTIRQQHINASLVILAACETGRGDITGDGVQGVARMFIIAGAKNSMVSLWSVPQDSTLNLLEAFHHFWKKQNQNIAVSLRKAQLELYDKPVSTWAGFIVIGEGK